MWISGNVYRVYDAVSFTSMASCSEILGRICPSEGLGRLSTAWLLSSGVMFIQSGIPFKNCAMGPDWAVRNCPAGIPWSMLSQWLLKSISRSSLLSIDGGRGALAPVLELKIKYRIRYRSRYRVFLRYRSVMLPGQRELSLRSEWHWAISYTILNPIYYDMTFDILCDISMRYRTFYVRFRRHETSISTTLFMTFDIEGLWPSISSYQTFNI